MSFYVKHTIFYDPVSMFYHSVLHVYSGMLHGIILCNKIISYCIVLRRSYFILYSTIFDFLLTE